MSACQRRAPRERPIGSRDKSHVAQRAARRLAGSVASAADVSSAPTQQRYERGTIQDGDERCTLTLVVSIMDDLADHFDCSAPQHHGLTSPSGGGLLRRKDWRHVSW